MMIWSNGIIFRVTGPLCGNSPVTGEFPAQRDSNAENVSIWWRHHHYNDVIMGAIASQITSLTIVYSTVHSGADQTKHQSSASLAFVWEIHRWPVNFPHKWPVTRKMFPFDDVIMMNCKFGSSNTWPWMISWSLRKELPASKQSLVCNNSILGQVKAWCRETLIWTIFVSNYLTLYGVRIPLSNFLKWFPRHYRLWMVRLKSL